VTPLSFTDDPDGARRRRLLWSMPTGIYVVGSTGGTEGPYNLMTHSLAVQVATEPCVVALAIDVTALTHGNLEATGVATLSVLRRDQRDLVRRFVKPVSDVELDERGRPKTMAGVEVLVAASGAPCLADAAGCLDLGVVDKVAFASHTLFCCEVRAVAVAAEVLEGLASTHHAAILRMEDTKMNYGG
jgi:flavin reductase (DIM6/NTAB) family NADH-FMN oxidoreductase RutF